MHYVIDDNKCLKESMTKEEIERDYKLKSEIERDYKLKGDFIIIDKTDIPFKAGNTNFIIGYPAGCNGINCVVLSLSITRHDNGYPTYGFCPTSLGFSSGAFGQIISLRQNGITINLINPMEGNHNAGDCTLNVRLVLMRIS